jgi:hypothetical protein
MQPGIAGQSAIYIPSSSRVRVMVNFIGLLLSFNIRHPGKKANLMWSNFEALRRMSNPPVHHIGLKNTMLKGGRVISREKG